MLPQQMGLTILILGASNASPSATETFVTNNNYQIFSIAVADFDGDSDLDIASLGNGANRLDWYANERIELSTNNQTIQKLNIYPNPTSSVLNFKGLASENQNIQIYDVVGKVILKTTIANNESLDVSALSNGFYTIHFAETNKSIKFIKN